MASSHTPARRTVGRILVGMVAAGGLTLTTLPASASPEDPATSREAAALVAARAHDLEVVTERFNEAREQLRATQEAAAQATEDVAAAEAALAAAREQVRSVARSAWTGDRLTTLSAMLTSDSPDELLDRVGTLQAIADHTNGVLGVAQQATDAAAAARTAAERTEAEAETLLDRVTAQRADLDRQVAQFQAEYDRLAAEEQRAAREAAERHAAEEAAREAAEQQAAEEAAAQAAAEQQAPQVAPAPAEEAPVSSDAGPEASAHGAVRRGLPPSGCRPTPRPVPYPA
ncbi:NlpC/P60 family protein [Geodermatophilus sp. DF01-2]|uniref:coiled-coil domain-containing protein n=1 Tax=Geodermatophilus sp. DF01-2 TaxID=2559610 RepID=UPI0010744663|nr:NlpC/P60 family protein [Geodermatophilus sp. DF01_2]TFV54780.1 NlpC/P60 family protein [Geodermatophilus sp. DF01_2]